MTTIDNSSLADALFDAMSNGKALDRNTVAPLDVEAAYKVQAEVFQRSGRPLEGLKLSKRADGTYSAPLFSVIRDDRYQYVDGIVLEVELAFTLQSDLPPRGEPWTREEVVAAIGTVSIGAEFVRSRYEGGAGGIFALGLADSLSNISYAVGPELSRAILEDPAFDSPLKVLGNGATLYDAPSNHQDIDPVAGVIAYANSTPSPLGFLRKGQVVTTGTLCGAVKIAEPARLEILLDGKSFIIEVA
jgi:2-keto-4-pentenoate hydratase